MKFPALKLSTYLLSFVACLFFSSHAVALPIKIDINSFDAFQVDLGGQAFDVKHLNPTDSFKVGQTMNITLEFKNNTNSVIRALDLYGVNLTPFRDGVDPDAGAGWFYLEGHWANSFSTHNILDDDGNRCLAACTRIGLSGGSIAPGETFSGYFGLEYSPLPVSTHLTEFFMKTILVTGANGLIAKTLIPQLEELGFEVLGQTDIREFIIY